MPRLFPLLALAACASPTCPTGQAWDATHDTCAAIAGWDSPGDSASGNSSTGDSSNTADSAPGDSADTSTAHAPRRILLLTLDTTRRDAWDEMPTLVGLEAEGTSLPRLWGNTWTYPSIGKLLTSQPAVAWGPESWQGNGQEYLSDSVPTVLEHLHDQGFAVLGYNANDGQGGRGTGLVDADTHEMDAYTLIGQGDPTFVDGLPAALAPYADRDTLLWVHLADAHDPYTQMAESCADQTLADLATGACPYALQDRDGLERMNQDLASATLLPDSATGRACSAVLHEVYACGVAYQDEVVARLVGTLRSSGFWTEDTWVAIVTDHGEGLMDPWVLHGSDMRATVSGVRALLIGPGVDAGAHVDVDKNIADIVPSLLALADVPAMPTATGHPYWEDTSDVVITQFFGGVDGSGTFQYLFGAIGDGYHLIQRVNGDDSRSYQLYDIDADPLEQHDLALTGTAPPQMLTDSANSQAALVVGQGYCTN